MNTYETKITQDFSRSSHLHIAIAYYMQKGGGLVQIACKIAYVLNGRLVENTFN